MIRHSSSFFISLFIHILLAVALFYTFKSFISFEGEKDKKVKIKLCSIIEKKEIIEPVKKPEKIIKPKQIKPQPIKQKPIKPKEIKKTVTLEDKKSEIVETKIIEPAVTGVQEPILSNADEAVKKENIIEKKELNPKDEYLNEHIKLITKLLQENLYYPRSARRRGIEGEVVVKFTLSCDSKVHNIQIISSSSEVLSRSAIVTIEDLSEKFPKPKQQLTLSVPIIYSLSQQ